jgi:rod shape-determining protein MreD
MINNLLRGFIYFVVFVLIQVLVLNNIHFLRIATPFLYLYFIIKMPVGSSRTQVVFFSFIAGVVIDTFSNTPGMHAAACTLAGFCREPLIRVFMGKICRKVFTRLIRPLVSEAFSDMCYRLC